MLTTRDYEVIEFIKQCKIATSSTIDNLFYHSKRVCQRRMKAIYEENKVKRIRSSVSSEYIYFIKMPKQQRHALLVTEFLGDFASKYDLQRYFIEPDFQTFRPDAFIGYSDHGVAKVAFLEVEISNKGFNYGKYEKFYMQQGYKALGIPFMPPVYVVGKATIPKNCNVEFIQYELKEEN